LKIEILFEANFQTFARKAQMEGFVV